MHKKFKYRLLMFAAPAESGGSEHTEDDTEAHDKQPESHDDEAKAFSRALAKRVEQIEAKYADYEDIKAKLAEYESREQSENDTQKTLEERIAALEQERDSAKSELAHAQLVDKLAHDTGVDRQIIDMLAGEGDELESRVKALSELLKSQTSQGLHTAPHARGGEKLTAKQMLAQAYSK